MDWLPGILLGILKELGGFLRKNERQQEARRSSRRLEYDRMMDLTLSANNIYTGTFLPDENRLTDSLVELRARALSQDDPQLEDAIEEQIQAIRNKELKSFVRNKTEQVVRILSDTKRRI